MSLDPGDYSLNVSFGEKFESSNYLVISNRTGTVWTFNERSDLTKFFTGRAIQFYTLFNNKNQNLLLKIEKEIYGENGRLDRLKHE